MRVPLVLALLSLATATAPAQDAAGKACHSVVPTGPHVLIDASSMSTTGSLTYPKLMTVPVYVHNKNPYKYDYQFTFTSQILEAAPVEDLLKRLAIPLVAPAAAPAPAGGAATAAGCGIALSLDKLNIALKAKLAAARQALDDKVKLAGEVNAFIAEVSADSIGAKCVTLYDEAKRLQPLLPDLSDVSALKAELGQAQKDFDAYKAQAIQGSCNAGDIADEINAREAELKDLQADVQTWATGLGSKENQAVRQALAKRIHTALNEPTAFRGKIFDLPEPDEPTAYTITGARQERFPNSGTMTRMAQEAVVKVGRSRFSLSGGVGLTTLGQRTIGRVPSPTDPTKQVFGLTEDSSIRPALVVLGTGHVYQFDKKDVSLGLSLGALVAPSGNANATVEYVMGPTVGLLRNLLLLTGGVHVGRRDKLTAFQLGDPVPGSATDELPLQKNWRTGFMFAITYRFK